MRLANERRQPRPGPGLRRIALPRALILVAFLLGTPSAFAQPREQAQPVDGALVAWGELDQDDDKLRRRATARLAVAGAGQFTPDQVTPWTALAADDASWLSPLTLEACDGGARSAEGLAAELEQASLDLQFGRLDRARELLEGAEGGLACLDGLISAEGLHSLWFLRGALEYLEGREGEARLFLRRAAQVDRNARFDDSFPPALHDLAVRAKDEALAARKGRASFLVQEAVVRFDGRPVTPTGAGSVEVGPGLHVVQVERAGELTTRLLRTEGVGGGGGEELLVVADRATAHGALQALFEPTERRPPVAEFGGRLLDAWLASAGKPWALMVDASPRRGEPRVVETRSLSDEVIEYEGRPRRGDDFTRRVRLAGTFGWRGQQGGAGVNDAARNYLVWSVGVWVPVHWWVRLGIDLRFSHTNNPQPVDAADPDGETNNCCTLPELSFRGRLEWPTGRLRPYAEGAVLIAWPYSFDPEHPTSTGLARAAWGTEAGAGLLITPGADRRIGVNFGGQVGLASEIRAWVRVFVGLEVRL